MPESAAEINGLRLRLQLIKEEHDNINIWWPKKFFALNNIKTILIDIVYLVVNICNCVMHVEIIYNVYQVNTRRLYNEHQLSYYQTLWHFLSSQLTVFSICISTLFLVVKLFYNYKYPSISLKHNWINMNFSAPIQVISNILWGIQTSMSIYSIFFFQSVCR